MKILVCQLFDSQRFKLPNRINVDLKRLVFFVDTQDMDGVEVRLITALDYSELGQVKNIVSLLGDKVDYYKVGLELFVSCGIPAIEYLKEQGKKVFLDLKFHDIPNTASRAVSASAAYGVDMVNIHTQGGAEMMTACASAVREAAEKHGSRPLLLGVTLLTSLDAAHFKRFSIAENEPADYVLKLAAEAQKAGLDGVVSSALETKLIKDTLGKSFITVTPGIRLAGGDKGDQKRIVTPEYAKTLGTDYIVVGRPITAAADPKKVAAEILGSIA